PRTTRRCAARRSRSRSALSCRQGAFAECRDDGPAGALDQFCELVGRHLQAPRTALDRHRPGERAAHDLEAKRASGRQLAIDTTDRDDASSLSTHLATLARGSAERNFFCDRLCDNNHSDTANADHLRFAAMKGKRRRSRNRSSKPKLPQAAQVIGFTDDEEAFFRAGDTIEPAYERPVSWL